MRKGIRRLLPLMLCTIMVLSSGLVAFAASSPTEPLIDHNDTEKKISDYSKAGSFGGLREATDEDMQRWNNVEKQLPKDTSSDPKIGAKASWTTLTPFTYYGQLTNYSCGAASVRMALKYLTGTTYAESTIRTGTNTTSSSGTTIANMISYINDEQDENVYVGRYNQSKATMKNNLYSGVATFDAPSLIGIQESTSDGWPFDLAGHAVAIYAAMSDKSDFGICDPWAGYVDDDDNRWYVKSDDDLYDAYDAINGGYMY
mgnify:FL=1